MPLRVLRHGEGEAAANMAADALLLAGCLQGDASPPTLRLYRWRGPSLTLGRFQPEGCLDLAEMARRGVAWARRPSGGRAVWHGDSVTFALAGRVEVLGASPGATNALAQRVLAAALASLGMGVALSRRRAGERGWGRHPLCLAAPWQGETVTVGGFRVAGVAQARRGPAVLVQGSLALSLPAGEVMGLFSFPSAEERRVAEIRLRAAARGLRELAGGSLEAEEVEEALAAAWRRCLSAAR